MYEHTQRYNVFQWPSQS